jgi:hypothetical protein
MILDIERKKIINNNQTRSRERGSDVLLAVNQLTITLLRLLAITAGCVVIVDFRFLIKIQQWQVEEMRY